jgi:predicted house-cleaning noncanonical NTP pyrophosphatase (MazG superfamily)
VKEFISIKIFESIQNNNRDVTALWKENYDYLAKMEKLKCHKCEFKALHIG